MLLRLDALMLSAIRRHAMLHRLRCCFAYALLRQMLRYDDAMLPCFDYYFLRYADMLAY